VTFNKYSTLYLKFKKVELKVSTYDKYKNIVKNRLLPVFKDKNIADIKASDIKLWFYSIDDVGNKSKRHYLSVLSGIFQEALYDEVIQKNPVKYIRLPKVQKPFILPFNADEVKLILDYQNYHNFKFFLAIAFYTGMRSGEIIALKKSDFDFKNRLIKVQRSRSRFGESTPKTIYSIRDIPIIDILMPYLEYLDNKKKDDYIFKTQYKKPYRDTNVFISRYWYPMLKDLGIKYRRLYNTRHTFATNMLYRNLVTPVQLAQILGHSNTQMVFDVYVKYVNQNYVNFDRSMNIYL